MAIVRTGSTIVLENVGIAERLLTANGDAVRTPTEKTRAAIWVFQSLSNINAVEPLLYGVSYYIKHHFQPSRRLTGNRGDGNGVGCRDESARGWGKEYEWELMKHPDAAGSGEVSYGDIVYVRVITNRDDRWLSGGRGGGGKSVVTRDMFSERRSKLDSYRWILKTPEQVGF